MENNTTLGEFIIENQKHFKYSSGELSRLINSVRLASKMVNHEVKKAGLVDITGSTGSFNVQGEDQQKLDLYANELFKKALIKRDIICGFASEEEEDFVVLDGENKDNKYVILIDPLDGSSNIDVSISVGTIFSIYRRVTEIGSRVQKKDFLQKGNKQVAAGYIIYGTSTMLVYTTGHGVNGFTLNPSLGTFYLSHPRIKYPIDGNIISVNQSNFNDFNEEVKEYINYLQKKPSSICRYIGSLVSDFHRNMLKGGIYMYPSTKRNQFGKLRLMYECNPMAFIAEQAGGKATNGFSRIMDIDPKNLHERIPMFCGNSKLVDMLSEFKA